jgi:hypothetical protein
MRLVHAPGIWVWNHLAIKFNGSGERTDNGYLRAESELTLYRFRNEQATISQALGRRHATDYCNCCACRCLRLCFFVILSMIFIAMRIRVAEQQ